MNIESSTCACGAHPIEAPHGIGGELACPKCAGRAGPIIDSSTLSARIGAAGIFRDIAPLSLKRWGTHVDGGEVFKATAKPKQIPGGKKQKGFHVLVHVQADGRFARVNWATVSFSLDLRDAAQVTADAAATAQAQAERAARLDAGRNTLRREAEARKAEPPSGRLLLGHGDVLAFCHPATRNVSYWHVGTIRGGALERGEDLEAALAENARRRAAGETVKGPESEGGGAPSWSEEVFLHESATVLASDRLTMRERMIRSLENDEVGGRLFNVEIGGAVLLERRRFVLVMERGHWLRLMPATRDADRG